MKKKEIIDFFEAIEAINNNEKILGFIEYKAEDKWFPKIDDLEKDFDILKKELKERRNQTNEAYKIYNSFICNCKHEISTYSSFYGMKKSMKNENDVMSHVVFTNHLPFLYIDDFLTKKNYLVDN